MFMTKMIAICMIYYFGKSSPYLFAFFQYFMDISNHRPIHVRKNACDYTFKTKIWYDLSSKRVWKIFLK